MFKRFQNIHFVGIGGIGMSGIAEVLINLGYRVSGSDQKKSKVTSHLKKIGAKIFYGHKASQVQSAHVVVFSSAVKPDNPEVIAAKRLGVPVIPRAEMLAELMRLKYGIAIAGSHGKTTTTSLVGTLLQEGGFDPTLVSGGILNKIRSNARLGKGEYLVAEADESDGSFMKLSPTIAVITNIDPEHMDHYRDFEDLKDTFIDFANKVPFYGYVVACVDHPVVKTILPKITRKVITYAVDSPADFTAKRIQSVGYGQTFEVHFKGNSLGNVTLNLMGRHNVANALAAIAIAIEMDIPFKKIGRGLSQFKGIQRRMQILLDRPDLKVIDDYGHHPQEIKATLCALRESFPKQRIVTLFQPHRYTRTRDLFQEFTQAFVGTDQLYLGKIYAAGEAPIAGISSENLYREIKSKNNLEAYYYEQLEDALVEILAKCGPGDILLTLGAGDITKLGHKIALGFKKKLALEKRV